MTFSVIDIAAQARIYAVQCIVSSTANWRELTAERFPSDPRNSRAASLLRALAAEPAETLPADLVARVTTFPNLSKPAREIAQKVGFTKFPESLAAFLRDVVNLAAGGGVR
jgi:hypothetical protein